MVEKNQQR